MLLECILVENNFRCAKDPKCFACRYGERICGIIHVSTTQGQTFVSSDNWAIYILQDKHGMFESFSLSNNALGFSAP